MISHHVQAKHSESLQRRGRKYFEITNRYDAARRSDFVHQPFGIVADGSSADYHYASESDFYRMAELAWDLYRNNALVAPAVDRLCANVLQQGFQLEPDTGRKGASDQIRAKWQEYATSKQLCDIQGEFDFTALSMMALRDSIVGGDIVGLPLTTGQVQLVESHRIRTPRDVRDRAIVHGVELDSNRRRVAYFVTRDEVKLNSVVRMADVREYRVYDDEGHKQLFHVWHPTRSTHTRGVSKLVGCMDFVKMYGDVHFARLVQQQAVSAYTFVRERDSDFELPEGVEEEYNTVYDECSGTYRSMEDVTVGSQYTTFPGEQLKVLNSNVPSPSFFDHCTAIEQLIGLNLDLPLIVMKLDASETNFSGWRGAIEQAKLKFRYFQNWFADCVWYRPIFEFKLRQWTNSGSPVYDEALAMTRERIGDQAFFRHEWIAPGWPYVNPADDLRADAEAVGNCLTSMRRIQRQRGKNWQRIYPEIIEDRVGPIEAAIKAAIKLNDRYGPDVNPQQIKWSDLMAFPRPQGDNVSDSRDLNDANRVQPTPE